MYCLIILCCYFAQSGHWYFEIVCHLLTDILANRRSPQCISQAERAFWYSTYHLVCMSRGNCHLVPVVGFVQIQWFGSSWLWLSTRVSNHGSPREIRFEFEWGQGFSFANSLLFCNWLFKVCMLASVLLMWCEFASRCSIELHSTSTSFTVLWFNGLPLVQADYHRYPFSLSLPSLYHQNTSFGMNHRNLLFSLISCLCQVAWIKPAIYLLGLQLANQRYIRAYILNIHLNPADNYPNPHSLAHFPSWSISPAHFASITLIDYSLLFFSLLQLRCLRFIRFLFNTNLRSVTTTSIYLMQF